MRKPSIKSLIFVLALGLLFELPGTIAAQDQAPPDAPQDQAQPQATLPGEWRG